MTARRATVASLVLVFVIGVASAADRLSDPTHDFVEGYDPSDNDFFANTPERTVLLRIRDDLDGDGVADLALSESSTWGNAGGQWLLFHGQRDGGYAYWGTLFFSSAAMTIGPQPRELSAYVRTSASRGSLQVYQLGPGALTLARERPLDLDRQADRTAYEAALAAGRRPAVEHCKLLEYRHDPTGCWRPGLGL